MDCLGRCLWNNVLLLRELPKASEEAVRVSGLGMVMPPKIEDKKKDIAHNEVTTGEIVDMGPGVNDGNTLEVGLKVLHGKYAGKICHELKAPEGFEYYLLSDKDIIFVLA